jgi:integrase/recombinase XerD
MSTNPNLVSQLRLKQLPNDELFQSYFNELLLRGLSNSYIKKTTEYLLKFKEYLHDTPPTPELAKSFLAPYANHKPSTFTRYVKNVKLFLKWYGTPLDIKLKPLHYTPAYHTEQEVLTLIEATDKKTHKGLILRDTLLIQLAITSGMRRAELASICVGDIDFINQRIQITGKGNKTRTIPLLSRMCDNLKEYCKDKHPKDNLFGLKAGCISNQIRMLAKKAGVDLHTHSLRHYFGTRLVEKGANIRAIQELMGHSNLNTTQVYLGVTAKHLEDTVKLLEV